MSDLQAKVHSMTGRTEYTKREAAYDLKKLRAKQLITCRRSIIPPGRAEMFR